MAFVGGPRQVGKTTFGLRFLVPASSNHPGYLSWDDTRTRSTLIQGLRPRDEPVVVLDEVHKFAHWRHLVDGFSDTRETPVSFIVTGSARLDHYHRGGPALQGRYGYFRLHPFTLPEMDSEYSSDCEAQLNAFGGFPEPLIRSDTRHSRRWQRARLERIVYEDVRELETVREHSLIELLITELPARVGSPLSVKALAGRLRVAHATAERWLTILERLYVCFRIAPFSAEAVRAVKKEQKLYMWDWSTVDEQGPRFENMVASHLLKYCHYIADTEGHDMALAFIRDTDRREVDFAVLRDGEPLFAVDCHTGEKTLSRHIPYFQARTRIPKFYQVHQGKADWSKQGIRCLPFRRFCKEEGLV
jgi:predicted AAA+ superfamily ATPase